MKKEKPLGYLACWSYNIRKEPMYQTITTNNTNALEFEINPGNIYIINNEIEYFDGSDYENFASENFREVKEKQISNSGKRMLILD